MSQLATRSVHKVKPMFAMRKRKNLTDVAYEAIKHMIVYNEVHGGTLLSENVLAEELQMSRTPIREALRILERESLVEVHNGVGTFVRQVSRREIHDLFEVRKVLESLAVSSFSHNITASELEEMIKTWESFLADTDAGIEISAEVFAEHDHIFHSTLLEKADNEVLQDLMCGIRERIQRIQALSVGHLTDRIDYIEQHINILYAVREKDVDKAQALIMAHIQAAENNVLRCSDFVY